MALSQKLVNILTDAGYVRHQVLLPDQVTVHPSNRDGVGLLVTDVHDLVEDIVETGWSDCVSNLKNPSRRLLHWYIFQPQL